MRAALCPNGNLDNGHGGHVPFRMSVARTPIAHIQQIHGCFYVLLGLSTIALHRPGPLFLSRSLSRRNAIAMRRHGAAEAKCISHFCPITIQNSFKILCCTGAQVPCVICAARPMKKGLLCIYLVQCEIDSSSFISVRTADDTFLSLSLSRLYCHLLLLLLLLLCIH